MGGAASLQGGSRHPHHQLHGLLGFVAVGLADDVHSPLVGDVLQALPIHRHQLLPSLAPVREGSGVKCSCFGVPEDCQHPVASWDGGGSGCLPSPWGVLGPPHGSPHTLRMPLRKAAPPGKIFSIFTTGCALDSMPPEMLIPAREPQDPRIQAGWDPHPLSGMAPPPLGSCASIFPALFW